LNLAPTLRSPLNGRLDSCPLPPSGTPSAHPLAPSEDQTYQTTTPLHRTSSIGVVVPLHTHSDPRTCHRGKGGLRRTAHRPPPHPHGERVRVRGASRSTRAPRGQSDNQPGRQRRVFILSAAPPL
jgi:hypothetical protein